jgi:hypothetical protein
MTAVLKASGFEASLDFHSRSAATTVENPSFRKLLTGQL